MTLVEQLNHRLNQIAAELDNIQRSADGWEYHGGNMAGNIRNEVRSIRADLIQLKLMAEELTSEGYPMEMPPGAYSERLRLEGLHIPSSS